MAERVIGAATSTCAVCQRAMVCLDRDLLDFRGQGRKLCPLCAGDLALWLAGLADIVERRQRGSAESAWLALLFAVLGLLVFGLALYLGEGGRFPW